MNMLTSIVEWSSHYGQIHYLQLKSSHTWLNWDWYLTLQCITCTEHIRWKIFLRHWTTCNTFVQSPLNCTAISVLTARWCTQHRIWWKKYYLAYHHQPAYCCTIWWNWQSCRLLIGAHNVHKLARYANRFENNILPQPAPASYIRSGLIHRNHLRAMHSCCTQHMCMHPLQTYSKILTQLGSMGEANHLR